MVIVLITWNPFSNLSFVKRGQLKQNKTKRGGCNNSPWADEDLKIQISENES